MGDAQSSSLLAENHPSWSKFYVKLFPFEIVFFLFQFSEQFYRLLYQQYYFQHLANVSLSEQPNYTAPSHSICLNQDYIVNHTDDEKFVQLQTTVNHLNMYSELILLGTSALSALLLGPLSDIIGRKPIIITIIIGVALTAVTQFIVIYFNLNVYYYLLCAVFYGGFGGYGAMITVMIATVNDVTPKRWLTIRIGIIESCVGLGKVLTALACNNWIQNNGCNFQPPAWLMIVVSALALISSLIIPETLSKDLRIQYKTGHNKGFKKLSTGVKIFTQPHFIGWRNYWQLWTASCVICCASFGLGAVLQILNYFLHNKPLEWSYNLIGLYGVVFSGAMALSLIVVLPILVLCKLSNSFICLIGAVFAIVTNVLIATVKTNWEMFLGELVVLQLHCIYFQCLPFYFSWWITGDVHTSLSYNEIKYH